MKNVKTCSILKVFEGLEDFIKKSFEHPRELQVSLNRLEDFREILIDFPFLENSFRTQLLRNFLDARDTEFDKHKWFKENHKSLLGPKYEITKRPNDPKHIPDFWLLKEQKHIPVEIKLQNFDCKSLEQLQRYMDFYESHEGVAVAKNLTCELPGNIVFIPFNKLEVEK